MPWVEREADPYEAYAGPETGGFNVVPQSAVPQMDPAALDFISKMGTLGSTPVGPQQGAPAPRGRWVERGSTSSPATGLTVAPKGAAPRMGSPAEAAAMRLVEPLMHPAQKMTQSEAAGIAASNQGLRWLINLPNVPGRIANAIIGAPGTVPDIVNADPEEVRAAFVPGTAQDQYERSAQAAQQFPWTTTGVEIGTDVLNASLLRQGAVGPMRRGEQKLTERAETAAWEKVNKPPLPRAKSPAEYWSRKVDSPKFLKIARGSGRVAEATVEGMVMSAINDGNPITTGAMAGTGQLLTGGTLALASPHGPTSSLAANIGIKAAGAGVLIHLLTDGFVLPDLETGFDKVKLGLGAAVLAGLAGGGRLRTQNFTANAPRIADAVASLPRLTLISIADKYQRSDTTMQQRMKNVLTGMANNAFTPEQMDTLGRAFNEGGDAFVRVFDRMGLGK